MATRVVGILAPAENWPLVPCITNLGRIHEKLFKLSRPHVNINAYANKVEL